MKYITAHSVEQLLNILYREERRLGREGYSAQHAAYRRARLDLYNTVKRPGAEPRTLWIEATRTGWEKSANRKANVTQTQLRQAAWQEILLLVKQTLKYSDTADDSYTVSFRNVGYQVYDVEHRSYIVFKE